MGGEWRAFWELSENEYSVFHERFPSGRSLPEERTDVYILLPDDRLGLKLRNETRLELKIKTAEKNNRETWHKKIASHIQNESEILMILESSSKSSKKISKKQELMKICSTLYKENENNLMKIKVEKTRWKPNWWLEETDIICKAMDDTILGKFRTVSFNTAGLDIWNKAKYIILDIETNIKNPFYGGYPGFLMQLQQQKETNVSENKNLVEEEN